MSVPSAGNAIVVGVEPVRIRAGHGDRSGVGAVEVRRVVGNAGRVARSAVRGRVDEGVRLGRSRWLRLGRSRRCRALHIRCLPVRLEVRPLPRVFPVAVAASRTARWQARSGSSPDPRRPRRGRRTAGGGRILSRLSVPRTSSTRRPFDQAGELLGRGHSSAHPVLGRIDPDQSDVLAVRELDRVAVDDVDDPGLLTACPASRSTLGLLSFLQQRRSRRRTRSRPPTFRPARRPRPRSDADGAARCARVAHCSTPQVATKRDARVAAPALPVARPPTRSPNRNPGASAGSEAFRRDGSVLITPGPPKVAGPRRIVTPYGRRRSPGPLSLSCRECRLARTPRRPQIRLLTSGWNAQNNLASPRREDEDHRRTPWRPTHCPCACPARMRTPRFGRASRTSSRLRSTSWRNISWLPWVHGLRVMPDVHLWQGRPAPTPGPTIVVGSTPTTCRSCLPSTVRPIGARVTTTRPGQRGAGPRGDARLLLTSTSQG